MNRVRIRFAATLVATALCAGSAAAGQATQAPPMTSVLAGKKFTPPVKGEAALEYTAPVTKREKVSGKDMVVTRVTVKNTSLGPIPRLTISETWYDKANNVITGGRGIDRGSLAGRRGPGGGDRDAVGERHERQQLQLQPRERDRQADAGAEARSPAAAPAAKPAPGAKP